jgi:kynurenine formamidase
MKRATGALCALAAVISIAGLCPGIDTENSDVADLTRPVGPGFGSFLVVEEVGDDGAADGVLDRRLVFVYDPGLTEATALVSPRRWLEGGATLDDVPVSSLIVPVVIIDATDIAGGSGEFALDAGTLMRYETFAGEIPEGAAVLVALTSRGREAGVPPGVVSGPAGYPGLAPDAVKFLVEKRHVSIIGVDTPGIDPSGRADNEAATILAKAGGLALVNLVGVDELPSRGGVMVISPLAMKGADAAPARVFVLVPKSPEPPVE